MSGKERQEQEAAGLRETLQEQRAHIDVLDSALSNAQSTVLRLEEEVRQKEVYVDRVKSMTKSLEQLQVASEKREGMEKKLRQKLEEELEQLRRERDMERKDDIDVQQLARQMAEQEVCESLLKILAAESHKYFPSDHSSRVREDAVGTALPRGVGNATSCHRCRLDAEGCQDCNS